MFKRRLVSLVPVAVLLGSLAGCITSRKDQMSRPLERSVPESPDLKAPSTLLASYRTIRQVSMFYRLDLRKDNGHSPKVAAAIRLHDSQVRDCYATRLDSTPQLRGNVELTFALSKSAQAFRDINRVGGTMTDKSLVGCLKQRIAEIPVNPPHDIYGSLDFNFSYKDDRVQSK